ncbi:type II toxin-antitoxin system VapC family toxin [uncultured Thiodictyon sp.]|jgi:tRNA(fMet)-specific endonuclease VapC|uniref:type II toxin-antitoxin system VapC family toxin n=1 Tax=uncultured Thiodictyon sp. TaxID=1846217 RepID=UPI0025EA6D4A|nr:type II toxin-antitoxin system VapC family toxin [uncultured Thiodictyon sp.]
MRYLLDTNVWSEMARSEPMASVRRAFHRYDLQFAIAAPVADELTFGVARLPNSKRKMLLAEWLQETLDAYPILPFDLPAARWHGQERAHRMAIGRPAPMIDGQIAAIAVVNRLILVTRNTDDFDGYLGLEVENWFTSE